MILLKKGRTGQAGRSGLSGFRQLVTVREADGIGKRELFGCIQGNWHTSARILKRVHRQIPRDHRVELQALTKRYGIVRDLKVRFQQCTVRSEEHTSELQSRGHLVCRLLLE